MRFGIWVWSVEFPNIEYTLPFEGTCDGWRALILFVSSTLVETLSMLAYACLCMRLWIRSR